MNLRHAVTLTFTYIYTLFGSLWNLVNNSLDVKVTLKKLMFLFHKKRKKKRALDINE